MESPEKPTHEQPEKIDDVDVLDRRTSERLPPDVEPTYVWVSMKDRIQTRMIDKSQGGIALIAPRTCFYEVGFQIRVEASPGRYRMANIVYVGPYDESHIRLGLNWEDGETS